MSYSVLVLDPNGDVGGFIAALTSALTSGAQVIGAMPYAGQLLFVLSSGQTPAVAAASRPAPAPAPGPTPPPHPGPARR